MAKSRMTFDESGLPIVDLSTVQNKIIQEMKLSLLFNSDVASFAE